MTDATTVRVPTGMQRWLLRLSSVALVLAGLVVGITGVAIYGQATRWDPLGECPLQVLLTDDRSTPIGQPVYYLDDLITVRGQKCVTVDYEVEIRGVLSWTSDKPPGFILDKAGNSRREPGCTQSTFANPIPPEVLAHIGRLTDKGVDRSEWHIGGVETPVRNAGREEGESRAWLTPTFTIIHTDRPGA